MTFEDVERERVKAGISQYALCQRAGVHPTTYSRRLHNPEGGTQRIIARLSRALESMKVDRQGVPA